MSKSKFVLEICVDSLDCAAAAQSAGADRIELCADLSVGGVTPSAGTMEAARAHLRIPIHVLIRPRPGDFVYSPYEFESVRNDIRVAKQLAMDGIVIGILDSESCVDVDRTRELVELARPMQITFHRAFDSVNDLERALEHVIETGADRILTSGPGPTAAESTPALAKLVKASAGRISIMPGGGVNAGNIAQILMATCAHEIHSSAGASSAGASRVAKPGLAYRRLDLAHYESNVRRMTSLLESLIVRN